MVRARDGAWAKNNFQTNKRQKIIFKAMSAKSYFQSKKCKDFSSDKRQKAKETSCKKISKQPTKTIFKARTANKLTLKHQAENKILKGQTVKNVQCDEHRKNISKATEIKNNGK